MADHSTMRLGKAAPRLDRRTVKLKPFLNRFALPKRPTFADWLTAAGRMQMYANDRYGCCAIAGPAHQVKAWTFLSGAPDFEPTEQQVLNDYFRLSGGVDEGLVLLDVMNSWRQEGFFGGHKIEGYVSIDLKDAELVRTAIWLFGSVTIGLALPLAAQDLDVWDVPPPAPTPFFHRWRRRAKTLATKLLFGRSDPWAPNSWGGHCVPLMAYDTNGDFACCTWGAKKRITPAFLSQYGDEGYVPLSREWVDRAKQLAPNGILYSALADELQRVAA